MSVVFFVIVQVVVFMRMTIILSHQGVLLVVVVFVVAVASKVRVPVPAQHLWNSVCLIYTKY
jgi:hypothetical protein